MSINTNKRNNVILKELSNVVKDGENIVTYDIICSNNTSVGLLRINVIPKACCIYIKNINIIQTERRKRYGTMAVWYLSTLYKDFICIGDILYPIAYDFWVNFDKGLKDCDCYESDLMFEFKL